MHRATDPVGGNCIELSIGSSRIVLDAGRPLDAPRDAVGLLPSTLDRTAPLDGVLISHPHQDHYGLIDELPAHWPIYSWRAAGRLMRLTTNILGQAPERDFRSWRAGAAVQIDAFRVTPYGRT